MTASKLRMGLAYGAGFLMSALSAQALAVSISLDPQGPTHFGQGSDPQSVSFNVVVRGLTTEDKVISAYDFGIGYDPALLTLQTWSFGSALGTGGTQVDNIGPDDSSSVWNYQTYEHPSFTPGTYDLTNYPAPGTPTATATYWEGSLRFLQSSFLPRVDLVGVDLKDLQQGVNNEITLLTLIFAVSTVNVAATEVFIIDDRNYLGFTHVPGSDDGLLDWKDDVNGSPVTMYLNKTSQKVSVPIPATLPLLALGLLSLGWARQRT